MLNHTTGTVSLYVVVGIGILKSVFTGNMFCVIPVQNKQQFWACVLKPSVSENISAVSCFQAPFSLFFPYLRLAVGRDSSLKSGLKWFVLFCDNLKKMRELCAGEACRKKVLNCRTSESEHTVC